METENTTSVASAETEADNTNADTNLSMEDLASSFMERVDSPSPHLLNSANAGLCPPCRKEPRPLLD